MERKLITLSLELMAAKDPLMAVVAFGRYFRYRLEPGVSELMDAKPADLIFPAGKIYLQKGLRSHVLLDLAIPKVFFFEKCKGQALTEYELKTIAELVSAFKVNYAALIELKGLTYTDDITGLYNHRYLEVVLDREFSLAKRNKSSFTVLFLDLDFFKKINDQHGHLIGSRLLTEVGQEIRRALRESDITFRYGGDEFVMVLTQTDMKDAMMVAERVRTQIQKKRFLAREGMDIRLTASIGVAAFPEHAKSTEQILKAADKALYGSKKETRNRVVLASLGKGL